MKRFVVSVAAASATALLVGCSSVGFNAGLPVLTKGGDGLLISETEGLPDLERGRQARISGNPEQALKDLKPLAERGYPEAMILLASTYLDGGLVSGRLEAERWYRLALKTRPEVGLSLAKLLIGYGKRDLLPEIDALISVADSRGDEEIDSVRIQRYLQFPDLDQNNDGDRIAQRALKSNLPSLHIQALSWFRNNIAVGSNVALLESNCRKLVKEDPSCFIDLAHFYRYRKERESLDKLIDEALVAFAAGSASVRPADSARLYAPPVQYVTLSGGLAAAMVDQINEELDDESQQTANANPADLDFEDDDFEGDVPPGTGANDVVVDDKAAQQQGKAPADAAAETQALQVVDLADKILRWMLKQGPDFVTEAAITATRYPFLLPELDLEAALKPAANAGVPAAVSALADLLFSSTRIEQRRPLEAIELYRKCLGYTATELRANSKLGRIYALGMLGNPDPQIAMKYYLKSARAGSTQAYASLARMFVGMPGIHINRVNAYVFAKRSADGGKPLVQRIRKLKQFKTIQLNLPPADMFDIVQIKLIDQITTDMTTAEIAQAENLYKLERAIQPKLKQPLPADIYSRGRPQ
ncbi:tetratricopeptide repeat protein [Nevskia ramosa]|uniref:tetratricopeptide repeat protein n=1 Tax=Nevskia ramosa TaxID=64002 RepID=UPI002352BD98|nr:hypothetical protein [Nevskia ramosa]